MGLFSLNKARIEIFSPSPCFPIIPFPSFPLPFLYPLLVGLFILLVPPNNKLYLFKCPTFSIYYVESLSSYFILPAEAPLSLSIK